jgi:hypothetical protein
MLELVAVHEPEGLRPVTARLSRRLHEQLGDEIANELVDWLNTMDEPYRSQIRELNDLNRDWFRAELATLRGELRTEFAGVRAEFRAEFADVRTEFRAEFTDVRAEFATFRVETERRFGQVDARLAEQRAELLKWMFLFWTATVVPLAGLIVALSDGFRS